MKFGHVPIDRAEGAVLAHSVRLDGGDLKKGRTLGAGDLQRLREAGVTEVLAASFEPGDVPEDRAAARLAQVLAAPQVRVADAFTGRANLFAEAAGVLTVDAATIDAVNRIDEAITIATLPNHAAVSEGQMLATVKIIPFSAPEAALAEAIGHLQARRPVLALHPYQRRRARLIQTELPGTSTKMLDKTARITEERMVAVGGTLEDETRCPHATELCARERPDLTRAGDGREVACHHWQRIPAPDAGALNIEGRSPAAERRFALFRAASAAAPHNQTTQPNKETAP